MDLFVWGSIRMEWNSVHYVTIFQTTFFPLLLSYNILKTEILQNVVDICSAASEK